MKPENLAIVRQELLPDIEDTPEIISFLPSTIDRMLDAARQEGRDSVDWEERSKDVWWLAQLKESGHCGESTSEAIQRERWNARIDRLLAALGAS